MKIIEIICTIILLIGIFFKLSLWPGGSMFTVLSLTIISWYYLIFGFAIFNDMKIKNIFRSARYKTNTPLQFILAILLGMSLSTILTGIMYKIQNWFIQGDILLVGLFSTIIILALYYFLLIKKIKKWKIVFLRSFIILIVGLISFFVF